MEKRTSLLLSIAFTLFILLSACASDDEDNAEADASGNNDVEEEMADEQVLNLASTSEIPTMDVGAAVDATSSNAMGAGFSGLMRLDENEQPVPDMAAEEPEVSDDQKTWTFKIREDAKWSNGDPVTARDFEFSWKRALSPKVNGEYSFLFEAAGIKNAEEILDSDSDIEGDADKLGVTAIDDNTLKVELSNPQPFFESLLWFGPFLPMNEDIVDEYGDEYAQEVDTMVYNGPFIMSEWNHGEGWTWEKNDDYWNADAYHLEEVNFEVVKDVSTQAKLFDQGEIDQTDLNGDELISKYRDDSEFDQGLEASTMSVRIGQRQPTLQNKKVRTALYNGIDREGLTDVLLSDGSVPAYYEIPEAFVESPEGEDFREVYPEINKLTKEEAADLWEEGLKEEGEEEVTYELYVSDKSQDEVIAEYLQDQLEDTFDGLTVEITKLPWKAFLESYLEKEYDLSYIGFSPDYNDPITFLDIFTTGHQQNTMDIELDEYDDMISEAKQMADDPGKRWELMQEAEKLLLEEASDIPLYQKGHSWVEKPYVKNMRYPVYGVNIDWFQAYIVKE